MTLEEACAHLYAAPFRVAKSMPNIPHSYTRRSEWTDGEMFNGVVQAIREHGVKEKFGKVWYTYLYFGGFKYWTMGWPVDETILINRAKA